MAADTSCSKVRVMLVDDHPFWIDALGEDLTELGCDVVAVAHEGAQVMDRARATLPDVVVMDLNIPSPDGATCTQMLTGEFPDVKVLVMSASGERDDVLRAVKAGASGYVLKSATKQELLDAVTKTAEGEAVFTATLAGLVLGEYRRMANNPGADDDSPALTPREFEVLRLVAKGLSYRDISEQLFVSHRTVQNHVQNVLRKLQLHNRVELTRYAIQQGLDT
ncbi:response regulator transcription factor [Propionimicrobium sp. PCR01-08-3]|uniref:response regulator n=1 Tax=Propionimicrobium sp. PCR01-08-3 TaxID=3052086 RepID=UPI00255CE248|nr:response regulator transcription factor [Propionimicrobium sp. PCR01-08-3]WIY81673.1 response regulator transcription factor [Propionimicrobium sp. PCR01-08-3]